MITVKYNGEIINIKDIEITWQEETYREWWGDGQPSMMMVMTLVQVRKLVMRVGKNKNE